jgi:hypothetical protein
MTIQTNQVTDTLTPTTGELTVAGVIDTSSGIFVNAQTITANYTIVATNNGLSAGPVSVASGITVTVSTGAVWTVV